MPLGTVHHIEGLLLTRDPLTLAVRLDGGGEWRIDNHPDLTPYIGRRIQMTGTRDGFDLLSATAAWLGDGTPILSHRPTSKWIHVLRVLCVNWHGRLNRLHRS